MWTRRSTLIIYYASFANTPCTSTIVQWVVEFKDAHTTKSPTFDVAFVLITSLLSVKDPAYKIPSLAFGLIVKVLVPSWAVFTKVKTLPIEIAGKVNTTPSVDYVKVLPESAFATV